MAKQEKKLTEWIDGVLKPIRVGYYQREYSDMEVEFPDYWNGKNWFVCDRDGKSIGDAMSVMRWRGLARRPR